ncbi:MAG: hypothetical protein ACE5JG_01350, partial [Planctomycetota bacterium]
ETVDRSPAAEERVGPEKCLECLAAAGGVCEECAQADTAADAAAEKESGCGEPTVEAAPEAEGDVEATESEGDVGEREESGCGQADRPEAAEELPEPVEETVADTGTDGCGVTDAPEEAADPADAEEQPEWPETSGSDGCGVVIEEESGCGEAADAPERDPGFAVDGRDDPADAPMTDEEHETLVEDAPAGGVERDTPGDSPFYPSREVPGEEVVRADVEGDLPYGARVALVNGVERKLPRLPFFGCDSVTPEQYAALLEEIADLDEDLDEG